LGEYSKIEEEIVYFKPQDAFGFQPVPVKLIQTLKLKEKTIYDASAVDLNNKEKINFPKSILTDSEKEIYEQAYSKKLRQRKLKHIAGITIVTGAVILFIYVKAMSDFDLDLGGIDVVQD
jgi:hypothetical protein